MGFVIGGLFSVIALPSFAQFKKLVWADEFNKNGLPDTTKWSYDVGGKGWGNEEKEFYTKSRSENAFVKNGVLNIKAIKEPYEGSDYTSARLLSKNKGDWMYGRFEIRAKLPTGRGVWPAIWMLPTTWDYGNWPHSGEIDIMENVGFKPDSLFGTVHTGTYNHRLKTEKGKSIYCSSLSDSFHVYSINWTKDVIGFYMDNRKYFEFANDKSGSEAWPFDKKFHLLLNLAIGGGWGGQKGIDDSIFPQAMQVDYVRVYQ
jgi:beta-glucanase (GH16 family)